MASLYDHLDVAPTASAGEIRAAYRRLARVHHPDAAGGDSARMAQINHAWHVLSDAGRRGEYDATLRATGSAAGGAAGRGYAAGGGRPDAGADGTDDELDLADAAAMARPRINPLRSYVDRPRFPWKLVLAIVGTGTIGILVFGSVVKPAPEPPLNNIIGPGSCVTIDVRRSEVAQASCNAEHDAVVRELVAPDAACPNATERYRDRQGRGDACVVRVTPAP